MERDLESLKELMEVEFKHLNEKIDGFQEVNREEHSLLFTKTEIIPMLKAKVGSMAKWLTFAIITGTGAVIGLVGFLLKMVLFPPASKAVSILMTKFFGG